MCACFVVVDVAAVWFKHNIQRFRYWCISLCRLLGIPDPIQSPYIAYFAVFSMEKETLISASALFGSSNESGKFKCALFTNLFKPVRNRLEYKIKTSIPNANPFNIPNKQIRMDDRKCALCHTWLRILCSLLLLPLCSKQLNGRKIVFVILMPVCKQSDVFPPLTWILAKIHKENGNRFTTLTSSQKHEKAFIGNMYRIYVGTKAILLWSRLESIWIYSWLEYGISREYKL